MAIVSSSTTTLSSGNNASNYQDIPPIGSRSATVEYIVKEWGVAHGKTINFHKKDGQGSKKITASCAGCDNWRVVYASSIIDGVLGFTIRPDKCKFEHKSIDLWR